LNPLFRAITLIFLPRTMDLFDAFSNSTWLVFKGPPASALHVFSVWLEYGRAVPSSFPFFSPKAPSTSWLCASGSRRTLGFFVSVPAYGQNYPEYGLPTTPLTSRFHAAPLSPWSSTPFLFFFPFFPGLAGPDTAKVFFPPKTDFFPRQSLLNPAVPPLFF